MSEVNAEIMRAVERFAASITVPVLHEYAPDKVDQVGTGMLFDHDGRLVLVTARHLFESIKAEDLVLPSRDTPDLHGLGPYHLHIPDREDIDLAVVEILHPASIARIRRSWRILSLADTAVASDDGAFVLTGYPSEKTKKVGGLIGSALLSLHTWRLPEVPATADKPVHPDLDLFFRYELTGENPEGKRDNIPHLRGCSGGPIWEYREPEGLRFWTVDQCVKLVGVQSSMRKSGLYFRSKSAKYIKAMLDKLVEDYPRI